MSRYVFANGDGAKEKNIAVDECKSRLNISKKYENNVEIISQLEEKSEILFNDMS